MQSCSACSSTPICLHPNKEPSNEGTQRDLFHSYHTTALRDALSSARPVVRSGQLPGRHQNNPHYSSCHKTLRVYSLLEQNLRAVPSIGLQPQQSASGLRALQHLNALAVGRCQQPYGTASAPQISTSHAPTDRALLQGIELSSSFSVPLFLHSALQEHQDAQHGYGKRAQTLGVKDALGAPSFWGILWEKIPCIRAHLHSLPTGCVGSAGFLITISLLSLFFFFPSSLLIRAFPPFSAHTQLPELLESSTGGAGEAFPV